MQKNISQNKNLQKNRKRGNFCDSPRSTFFKNLLRQRCEKQHGRGSEDEQQSHRVTWQRRFGGYVQGSEDAHSERSLRPVFTAALVTVAKM